MVIKTISSLELEQLLENKRTLSIIDVREDDEVALGKIPEAKHIRFRDIPKRLKELDKNEQHFIICHAGVRSLMVCEYLQSQGYDVVNVEGGMLDWQGEVK